MKYKCPKCGEVFEGPVKFCPSCGQALKITAPEEKPAEPKKKYKCPICGTIFEGPVKFCPGCGTEIQIKVEPKPVEEAQPASETKYKCPVCGAMYDKPVKFCNECGTELKFDAAGNATTVAAPAPKEEIQTMTQEVEPSMTPTPQNSAPQSDPVKYKKTGHPGVGWSFVILSFLFSLIGIVAGAITLAVCFYDVLDLIIGAAGTAGYPDLVDPLTDFKGIIDGLPVVPVVINTFGSLNLWTLIGAFVMIVMTFIFASIGHKNGGKVFNVFAIIFNVISILLFLVTAVAFVMDKIFIASEDQLIEFIKTVGAMISGGSGA